MTRAAKAMAAAGAFVTAIGPAAAAMPSPDSILLTGVLRDFAPDHPDFNVTDPSLMGQYAFSVADDLGADGNPVYMGDGRQVVSQWIDKDGHPIRPYGDRGLFGGHFDVDVYDAPSTKAKHHKHEFDDSYDVTYVDIGADPNLLFKTIAGGHASVRAVFVNEHNGGGGTFTFKADGVEVKGYTANGFDRVFDPSTLTEFKVNFVSLAHMSPTKPKDSQSDVADRDDAFAIRVYDAATNAFVYEIAVYHHVDKGGVPPPPVAMPAVGNDACGVPLNDTVGTYGVAGSGAVTDKGAFGQWFEDVPGTNLSTGHTIELQRSPAGVYEYSTDQFYPADDTLLGNNGSHNDFFTYEIRAFFTYRACQDMFFEFEGNDDCWVYINGKLVIDLGGANTQVRQRVALDRLGLVDGQQCTLQFFYAQRRSTGSSVFNMKTNIELYTGTLPSGLARYD